MLARAGIEATVLGPPRSDTQRAARLATLRETFTELIDLDGGGGDVRALAIEPSIEAWLTRDHGANQAVLGTGEVPAPDRARDWLLAREVPGSDRRYSAAVEGRALARAIDLGVLAAASPALRGLIASLSPGWTSPVRGRGRPPGVVLFRGTGYALCLELLHRGEGTQVTPAELIEVLHRTKTPVLRLIGECQRRGYLHRATPRGPLVIRRRDRLLDDLVTSVKAERARRPATIVPLATDRDPADLPRRVAAALAELGRVMALTGASAVEDLGGDLLVDVPVQAYAAVGDLPPRAVEVDAYRDARHPRLVLIEAGDPALLHRLRPGTPARVSPWQAVIDLLASESQRERDVGDRVRCRLEGNE
ncbi:MAG TPA: hypothetical protein VHE35_37635 [Kofleriaceae bacterium]|nr:hypothetical protein [Kofleriaceae bacterium]